ncbi:MAG: hypothetical protein A07HB70_01634 [uncultured archaeon A07HB70]|nr:MAG: hypothetical protein A07HB70_01634 [uncultured archaeon A07HB70]
MPVARLLLPVTDRVPVTYHCPRCGAVAELQRDPYLADQSVTPYPLAGWHYVGTDEDYESDDADGVVLACGVDTRDDADGCGEPFYLSFVRFEAGRRVDPEPEPEHVELAGEGPPSPEGPDGPGGPGSFRG